MVYTHAVNRGGRGVQSPADQVVEGGALGRDELQPNMRGMSVDHQGSKGSKGLTSVAFRD